MGSTGTASPGIYTWKKNKSLKGISQRAVLIRLSSPRCVAEQDMEQCQEGWQQLRYLAG